MDNGEENRLKQFRIHMNMTQQQMADLLKVGQNTYSRIENGVTAFKDVYKKIIEDKYHLTTGWLSGADVPMFKKYDAVSYAFIMFLCGNINMSVWGFFLILSP